MIEPTRSEHGAELRPAAPHPNASTASDAPTPVESPARPADDTVSYRGEPPSTVNLRAQSGLPRRFGDYELLGEIARGGMGIVYRARQVRLNRVVALKMILAGQFADEVTLRRFHTEAEAAAKLDHPNIVPIYEIGQVDGTHFFSMGLVEGGSLAARLRDGPLDNREAAELLYAIVDAVHYAHQRGVIHRDLKPGNVLLQEGIKDERSGSRVEGLARNNSSKSLIPKTSTLPKLTDFGLAKLVQEGSELTSTGQVMGTPAYMPPEQAAGQIDLIGPASDVYSLGAVMYCALTGRPPFHAAGSLETLQQVLHCEPVRPRLLNPAIDRDLETICLKCLEKNSKQRFASAGEMASELGRFLSGQPILARPTTAIERAGKWMRRRPAIAALLSVSSLAVVFLIALTVGFYFHRQLQDEKAEADRQRDIASKARDDLVVRNQEIEQQKSIVEQQKGEVERQKSAVEQQKSLVEIQRDRTRRIQYASDLNMADRAWQESQVGRMFNLLYRNVPQDGAPDLRGWEWYYLLQQGSWQHRYLHGTNGARSMALAPPSQLAATTGLGVFVDLWELESGRKRGTIIAESLQDQSLGELSTADSVAITPDGRTLVIGFHGGQLVAWDVETSKVIFAVQTGDSPRAYVMAVDVSADGQQFLAGDADGGLKMWNRAGTLRRDLRGLTSSVGAVRFSPDQRRVATACGDQTIAVWDAESGESLRTLRGHTSYAMCVAWSPDGRSIAGGAYNEEVRLWDAESGEVRHVLRGHRGSVNDVAFRPDGKTLASCAGDGTIRLWDVDTGAPGRVLRGHSNYIFSVAWTADGARIVSSSSDGSTRVWDLAVTPEATVLDDRTPLVSSVVFNRSGSAFATVRRDGGIVVRNTYDGRVTHVFGAGLGMHIAVEFHPNGTQLAASAADGTVRLWNLGDGTSRLLTQHAAGVPDIAFNPDGSRLATASDDKTGRIVDVATGEILHALDQHTNFVWSVAWSPDGRHVATGGHDSRLILWNPDTGERVRDWSIMNFPAGMTFSPDSQLIATPAAYGINLHSVATGEVAQSLSGHSDGLGGIAFSPDGRRVFTSSWDRSVKIWDPISGQETLTLLSADKVNRIALSPDGTRLAGVGDHTTTVWFAPVPPQIRVVLPSTSP